VRVSVAKDGGCGSLCRFDHKNERRRRKRKEKEEKEEEEKEEDEEVRNRISINDS